MHGVRPLYIPSLRSDRAESGTVILRDGSTATIRPSDPTDAARVDGYFYALDARTGELLWRRELTSSIQSPPITYAVRGRRYVAVAAGDTMFGFSLRP